MRLFIAEKQQVATAIANVLGVTSRETGALRCGQDTVTWCAGHMLALCDPEDYDPNYKRWSIADLPLVQIPWKYKVIPQKAKQLAVIKSLLPQASEIVHAGDTDAEGQLLVDEILEYYRVKVPVKRVLIADNNPTLVQRALSNLKSNKEFYGLSQSALARSVGDQLYGYNMTRLYTLKAKEQGYQSVLSVGRVQTPILGLVVNRDRAVENFTSHPYFLLQGEFQFSDKKIPARLVIPKDAPVDTDGRVIDKVWIEAVADQCLQQPAVITEVSKKEQIEYAPLPYDLLQLQADASRRFGFDPDKTLAITQALRDKYNLITYNRSDCRYLSDEQHADAPAVLAAIRANVQALAANERIHSALQGANASLKSRAFNSAHVKVHHGIVPTQDTKNLNDITPDERAIYLMIAHYYVLQFWPVKKSDKTQLLINCHDYQFKVTGSIVTQAGWSVLTESDKADPSKAASKKKTASAREDESSESDEDIALSSALLAQLNQLKNGDQGQCVATQVLVRDTQPPKYYTMETLLLDLRRVAKYASPDIAKLLRERDADKKDEHGGIGTAATRGTFIAKLLERMLIQKNKGKLISTPLGREFHDMLPTYATRPDMTALWHQQQSLIERGELTALQFIEQLVTSVSEHINETKIKGLPCMSESATTVTKATKKSTQSTKANATTREHKPLPSAATSFACGSCGQPLLRRLAANDRAWYGCSGYPTCKQTYHEQDGAPAYEKKPVIKAHGLAVGDVCPECQLGNLHKKIIEKGNNAGKFFLGCHRFPSCRFFQWARS